MTRRGLSLAAVLAILAGTLVVGLVIKRSCIDGSEWVGQQYVERCYTDILPLYGAEQLQGDRLPYLDACEEQEGVNCDEYPVLTMYVMRAAAWFADDGLSFFWVNALLLTGFAVLVVAVLHRMVGGRSLVFAAAPTLAIYAFVNWDLIAVAAATAGMWAFSRGRDRDAGVLLGVGAAAKLYPALFVVPLALQRWRDGDRRGAGVIAGASAIAWLALNAPFALLAPDPWFTFFRLSSERPADWDSLWFAACHPSLPVSMPWCGNTARVNALAAATLLAGVALVWWMRRRRDPDFPRWTLVLPFLLLFLLTNKVYSPQFSLWLLPLFALLRVDARSLVPFGIAEFGVFWMRFGMFASLEGLSGGNYPEQFTMMILVRAVLLSVMLVRWIRGDLDPSPDPMLDAGRVDAGRVAAGRTAEARA